jgi:hypothetical protein
MIFFICLKFNDCYYLPERIPQLFTPALLTTIKQKDPPEVTVDGMLFIPLVIPGTAAGSQPTLPGPFADTHLTEFNGSDVAAGNNSWLVPPIAVVTTE